MGFLLIKSYFYNQTNPNLIMKKVYILLISIGFLVGACGQKETSSSKEEAIKEEVKKPLVDTGNTIVENIKDLENATVEELEETFDKIEHETDDDFTSLENEAKEIEDALNELDNL